MNIAKFEQQRKQLGKVIAAIVLLALLWCIYGVTIDAGAQTLEPTPVCTMTPEGEQCTSSVAMTGTPTATPVVPPPTSTVTPTPTATQVTLTPLEPCALRRCHVRIPIVFR